MVRENSGKAGLEPIFVSVADAADMLALSRWTMYQLLNEQAVKSVYQGRKRLVDVASLREYAASLSAYPQDVA